MIKMIAKLFIICIMLFMTGCEDEQISFREISFDTVMTNAKQNTGSLRPNIIVQVIPRKGIGESFVLSDRKSTRLNSSH